MTSRISVRPSHLLAAISLAAVLSGCAASKVEAPPPPPPAPVAVVVPPISLSPRLVEQASAYRAYVSRAGAISPGFTNGSDVAQGLKTGAAYEPDQLLRGAIAYGAVVALQDPGFRAGVRTYVADPDQRRQVAYEIMKDPAYALGIKGAADAAGLVMTALGDDGRKLYMDGKAVKQAAYDVQHSAWSKAEVVGREGRLALAKELSATPISGDVDITQKLSQAVTGTEPLTLAAAPAQPPYTAVVVRSVAVAALAALGYANDDSLGQVMPLTAEPNSAQCLNMAKLNLYQCLAVAKPHYEDVFCLGEHAMAETGSCLLKSAGVAVPEPPPPPALAVTKVSVPAKPARHKARKHRD